MKYKVTNITVRQTSKGDDYKQCDLVTSTGETFLKVPYWSSLPGYAEVAVGSFIDGTITSTQNGAYTNHKLSLANMPQRTGGGMGAGLVKAKTEAIKEAQANKNQSIEKAQERNEVMYAKKGASEIIAHHPAFAKLEEPAVLARWKNLVQAIYDFNPATTLTAREVDDVMAHQNSFQNAIADDDINPDDIPF